MLREDERLHRTHCSATVDGTVECLHKNPAWFASRARSC